MGLSHHDIHGNILSTPLKVNPSRHLEAKLAVDRGVSLVTRLQVTRPALTIRQLRDVLNELASMALSTATRPSANVYQVPGLEFSIAERGMHRVVEKGDELAKEATLAFSRQAEVQAPHARAEYGEIVIHVLAWWHPIEMYM